MDDLISRLSDLRSRFNCFDADERDAYHTLSEAIGVLSAMRESMTDDQISRQAAIDALDCINGVEEVLKALPSAEPEQRWIPVSERLPDEYGEYLVTKRTIGWNCEEYNSIDIAYFDNDGFHKAYKVLAWMPLPEPYQAERREE